MPSDVSSRKALLKFKLTIAYDGRGYAGWQVQKTGVGVQARVEAALGRLFPSVRRIHSSSRTDTGVHALGMVAHVEIPSSEFRMPVEKLALAINAHLPEDIRIMNACRCADRFHARFDARGKQYRYFVWNQGALNPLLRGRVWHVPRLLALDPIRQATCFFIGTHDFKSFAAQRDYEMESTVRTMTRCDVRRNGPLWTFILEADGFLYKMCRGIVGTLVQVGLDKIPTDAIPAILKSKDRRVAGMTAPAHGLFLWKVFYSRSRRPSRPSP